MCIRDSAKSYRVNAYTVKEKSRTAYEKRHKKVAVKSHKIAVKIRICLPLYPGVKDMQKKKS